MRRSTRRALALGLTTTLGATCAAPALASEASSLQRGTSHAPTGRPTPAPQKALDAELKRITQNSGVAAIASVEVGRRTYAGAAGYRNLQRHTPARVTDRARIGSETKPMVAVVIMQLVDEGKLALTTRIKDVDPSLAPGHGDITVEQLLSHRSGLGDYLVPLAEQEVKDGLTPEESFAAEHTDRELIGYALTQPAKKPGEAFLYSNANYLILSQMAQKKTRRSMTDLLRERVFRKAGMRHTFYATGSWMPGNALTEYYIEDKDPVAFRQNATIFSAAGAIVSTPEDVNEFWRALMAGRLTSKASLAQMLKPRSNTPMRYGLGVYQMSDPCAVGADGKPDPKAAPLYGHNGATYGTYSISVVSRDGKRAGSGSVTGRWMSPDPKKAENQQYPQTAVVAALKAAC